VQEGQNIIIIEAMKVMNQIKSPKSGTIVNVLIQDGQPVEFGTPLFELS
jgi:acetyl-CoA carboxylase biotin carboxyl carrier protein